MRSAWQACGSALTTPVWLSNHESQRHHGPVAQWQSGRLITDWSLVRIQPGPPALTKSKTSVLRFTLALQLVLRREPRPARSGPRQASFPCPHQPARADYSPSCQADMAAIRPPLTVSGASQASLRHTLPPPSVSGPAASWRLLPLLPAGTAAAAVPVNCASPGLPCLYAPARSVVIVTPGEKLTQYWCTKRLE